MKDGFDQVAARLGVVTVYLESDNVAGGRAAARFIAQNPGMQILASQDAQFDRARSREVMAALLKAYPGFDAVFAANDDMILGALDAMSAAGVDPAGKVTVDYDATPEALASIRQGKLGATADQLPGRLAGQALEYLVEYIRNKADPPGRVVDLAPKAVTAANLQ